MEVPFFSRSVNCSIRWRTGDDDFLPFRYVLGSNLPRPKTYQSYYISEGDIMGIRNPWFGDHTVFSQQVIVSSASISKVEIHGSRKKQVRQNSWAS